MFNPRTLEALHFDTIAEYGYFLAGEVAEGDLASFQRGAEERQLLYEIRRDFDLIQINGYTFSSFGEPTGLPEGLTIDEYEGNIGMYLVQFKAPVTPTWWRALKAAGEFVAYYPENTYLIRASRGDMPVLRLVNGVQHVSLFQPAYKVRRSLLTRDEVVEVDVEFDGDQDMEMARTAIRGILDEDVRTDRIGRFAYSRLRAALANREAILRRPEVTWVEPALQIEFSGERTACVTAGMHDGFRPLRPLGVKGHQEWLKFRGFCIPTETPPWPLPDCMAYWPKVGVIDSGLDRHTCDDGNYDESTGLCEPWNLTNTLHPDLNHSSNIQQNCESNLVVEGGGPDPIDQCEGPVIHAAFFCTGQIGEKHCEIEIPDPNQYVFSDTAGFTGHGSSVISIIVGDPWSIGPGDLDPDYLLQKEDPEGFYRGIGIAPSAQIIVAKAKSAAGSQTSTALMTHVDFVAIVNDIALQSARFVNNSWNLAGDYESRSRYDYTLFSKYADLLVRDGDGSWTEGEVNRGMTIVFSAGNWDTEPEPPAPPDLYSYVTSPANAKNVISVGAARGWAPPGNPGGHPSCFSEDARGYVIADIAGLSFGGDLAGQHSRRGYSAELGSGNAHPRFKPDLVAPGSHLAAGDSRYSDPQGENNFYRCFGGTSAAAPAVTASAVLAETWYWYKLSNPQRTKPSPAMVKAMLVAHADSMASGTDRLPPETSLSHSPSLAQGWGRVNLDPLVQEIESVVVYDQDHRSYPLDDDDDEPKRRFTGPGQHWRVKLNIDDSGEDVVIVMVYTDRFAEPPATSLTVNDLNLSVFQLGLSQYSSRTYYGNYFDADGYSLDPTGPMSGTPYDHVNTVEVIRIEAGELLSNLAFWVTVAGAGISEKAVPGLDVTPEDLPNQDFALYVYNAELVPDE